MRIEYRSRTNKNTQALARADIRHFAVLHPRDWSVAYDNLVFRLSQRGTLVKWRLWNRDIMRPRFQVSPAAFSKRFAEIYPILSGSFVNDWNFPLSPPSFLPSFCLPFLLVPLSLSPSLPLILIFPYFTRKNLNILLRMCFQIWIQWSSIFHFKQSSTIIYFNCLIMRTKDDIIYRNQFTWNMISSMDEQSGII